MFIENEVNIHTLVIEILNVPNYDSYQNDMFEIILRNRNFINNNVGSLKLYIDNTLDFSYFDNNDKYIYIKSNLLQIIKIHQNLKKIVLAHNHFPLFQSLLLSKGCNCSNTLNTIILCEVNFNGIINLDKIFEQLMF
ncbi:hypothetical protein RhiirC2_797686 [Rhizophagus irregularis]|uniref:Uncharacterized protein n=1 Tax=Rhizophagus irregularis TaxID=588596 RepID=A0A2N1M7L9_9GLOM|nr:hypothetical protein RhiirC2_797686 [Rhizophagus irregularis]